MQSFQPSAFNISFFNIQKAKKNFTTARKYVVGYARLSFDEDGENFISIENQMSILKEFYEQQYKDESSEYAFIADDNVSGYTFERNGLYRLISLIENGKCNTIIAKDLSRIGRHAALTQLFIEQCERVGVHIHAMSDYNSKNESDDLILGIRAWSNERVVKDTSAKIKKVVSHRQANGTWFCAAPFGYYVIDYQKGAVGIEEGAAEIVRRIFDMYVNGAGLSLIARTLTKEQVPTPSMFSRERAIAEGNEFKKKVSSDWRASYISAILSNEFYLGTLVTNRFKRDGINGKDVRTEQSEWLRFENHHEPIIDPETFEVAQEIKKSHVQYNFRPKQCKEHLFHGLVYCGECGAVEFAYSRKDLSMQYVCSTYFKYGKSKCSRHRIKEHLLINIAIDFLRLARDSCKEAIDSLDGELFPKKAIRDEGELLAKMERELQGLDEQTMVIESQRIKQIIAHPEREDQINSIYDGMIDTTQKNRDSLVERIEATKAHMSSASESIKKAKKTIDVIDQVIESKTLTRRAAMAIFERIVVHEDGNIDIELKPYLKVLDPKNYSFVVKPHNQPEETYNVKPQSAECDVEPYANDDCEGDPSQLSFTHAISLIVDVSHLVRYLSI